MTDSIQDKVEQAFTDAENDVDVYEILGNLTRAGEFETLRTLALRGTDDDYDLSYYAQAEYARYTEATTKDLDRIYELACKFENDNAIYPLYSNPNISPSTKREIAYYFHEEIAFQER